jgi:hypothetical protein
VNDFLFARKGFFFDLYNRRFLFFHFFNGFGHFYDILFRGFL